MQKIPDKEKVMVQCASLGIRMLEETAQRIDLLVKTLPKECRYKTLSSVDTKLELHPGERADISVITTSAIDRDGHVVVPNGIDRTEYNRNPMVLLSHNWDELPVGYSAWIKDTDGGLIAKTIYARKKEDHVGEFLPDVVYGLVQQGLLKGKSIGFLPTNMRLPNASDPPAWQDAELVVDESILLEYSVVNLPCNPDALVEAVNKGLTSPAILRRLGIEPPVCNKAADDCVSKKIRKLRDEGYKQEQAIAIAEKYCKENEEKQLLALVWKRLEHFRLDPEQVYAEALQRFKNRGKV